MDLCHVSRAEPVEANLLQGKRRFDSLASGFHVCAMVGIPCILPGPRSGGRSYESRGRRACLALLSPPPRQCRSAENFGSLFRRDVCPPGLAAFEPALATALLTALPS